MNKDKKIYYAAGCFLVVATFIYVFSGILGLSLPRYYPELNLWSVDKLDSPSMGFYGKVGFTLLVSLPLSLLFYAFLPLIGRFNPDPPAGGWRGLAVGSLLFGVMFFVAEEGHKWGVISSGLGGFSLVLILFLTLVKLALWIEAKNG